jgi:hypothetical protein
MDRDAITILLIARTQAHTGIASFEGYVSNANALYEGIAGQGRKGPGTFAISE